VPVYQVGEADGHLFLVMPLLPGRSLDARLKAGPVPPAEAVEIARQAAEGLAAAHAAGVVHRDIKPANLFLEDRPGGVVRVRLLDFGLARAEADADLTRSGAVLGTPAYMAPEQAFGRPADPRTDLFGLGGVLVHLLTGKPPFAADTDLKHRADPSGLPLPGVPPALANLVRRLLAADPADRPSSAADVARELATVRLAAPRRRRLWPAVAALSIGMMAVVAGLIVWLARPAVTPPTVETAPAAARRGTTLPPPAADFGVLIDADLAGLMGWVDGLRGRNLRPDALAARHDGAAMRFTAVAAADGREWETALGVTNDEWDAREKPLQGKFRPAAHLGYHTPHGDRFATCFVAAAGKWDAGVYPTVTALSEVVNGQWKWLRPVRYTAVAGRDWATYTVVVVDERPRLTCGMLANLPRPVFDDYHRQMTGTGLRLAGLDATATPDGPVFQPLWVKDGGESDFALDLTREQLDRQLVERKAAGRLPHTLSAYDTPGGLRFAVTWVPMR
jgi:hypothetical protein